MGHWGARTISAVLDWHSKAKLSTHEKRNTSQQPCLVLIVEQTWDRKKKWIECVNTAYQAWTAIPTTKNRAHWLFAPFWNKNHGQQPHV